MCWIHSLTILYGPDVSDINISPQSLLELSDTTSHNPTWVGDIGIRVNIVCVCVQRYELKVKLNVSHCFWGPKCPQNTKYKLFSYVTESTIRWNTQISSTLLVLDLQETVSTDKTCLSGRLWEQHVCLICIEETSPEHNGHNLLSAKTAKNALRLKEFEVFLYNFSSRRSHCTSLLFRSRFSSFYLLTYLVRILQRCDNARFVRVSLLSRK